MPLSAFHGGGNQSTEEKERSAQGHRGSRGKVPGPGVLVASALPCLPSCPQMLRFWPGRRQRLTRSATPP